MPFPNEHAARQAPPGDFDTFRRDNKPKGVSFIFGIKAGKSKLQSVRFARSLWTPDRAKKWLRAHKLKTGGFEQATGKADVSFANVL